MNVFSSKAMLVLPPCLLSRAVNFVVSLVLGVSSEKCKLPTLHPERMLVRQAQDTVPHPLLLQIIQVSRAKCSCTPRSPPQGTRSTAPVSPAAGCSLALGRRWARGACPTQRSQQHLLNERQCGCLCRRSYQQRIQAARRLQRRVQPHCPGGGSRDAYRSDTSAGLRSSRIELQLARQSQHTLQRASSLRAKRTSSYTSAV